MYSYLAYSLSIASDLELPELVQGSHIHPDIKIRLQELDHSPFELDSSEYYAFQCTAEGMYLYWQGVGTFLIRDGQEIIIDVHPDAELGRLRLFTLGAAIGVILHQRGYVVLHASAMAIGDQAIAFIGDKGWGKSTMAAALHARGHRLLSDDVLAIDLRHPGKPIVLPAFPQLKLWPDAVTSLGHNPDNIPQLITHLEKRDYRVAETFLSTPIPLHHIYLLGIDADLEIQPLHPQEMLKYLLLNSYVARFGNELLKVDEKSHFLRLTQLANQVPIHRLARPTSLDLLPQICELLEAQVSNSIRVPASLSI
jgi:hypothetical protein